MIQMPPRWEIKRQAKGWMLHPICLRTTLFLVSIQLGLFALRALSGANLGYALADLDKYGDTASGFYYSQEGFSLILRMDVARMVLAIPVSYHQLWAFLAFGALSFLILSPLRVGAMEQYWNVLTKKETKIVNIFRWFTQAGRLGKALVVEFVLQGAVRLLGLVAMCPAFYCYYRFYSTTTSLESMSHSSMALQMCGSALMFLAVFFTFWLHCMVLPVRYCLASHPEYSLREAFVRGRRSIQGYGNAFFGFRSSFLLWFALSYFTLYALDLFVLPYSSLSSMLFLQELARAKQGQSASTELKL